MGRPAIYTALTTPTVVNPGDVVPIGYVQRKYGCGISVNGTSILISEPGYYDVDVYATYVGTAGDVTLTLYKDGIAVPGATDTETIATAATQYRASSFGAIVRVYCCAGTQLSVVASGTSTPTLGNFAVKVVKL
ncbi:MAG: hypothetical protein MJ236_02240 [Clostridia bacterium]|nr:hypothetical protein [Clostridia bacterium]